MKPLTCFQKCKRFPGGYQVRCKKCQKAGDLQRSQEPESGVQQCNTCGETKPLSCFPTGRRRLSGHAPRCKDCVSSHSKRLYPDVAEAKRARQTADRDKYPERYLLYQARKRAKRDGLPFNITLEDIVIPRFCPILGIPLFRGVGRMCDNSPSLDQFHAGKGYIKGYVPVISNRANRIKSDGSVEEHRAVIRFLEQYEHNNGSTINTSFPITNAQAPSG
jgi:hypothetical protein